MLKIKQITCENMINPIAVTVRKPAFSWIITSDQENVRQTKYQILVTDEDGSMVWDSGVRESSETIGIVYEGKALQSCSGYEFTITVWDNQGECATSDKCSFETAFFAANEWRAKWIEPKPLPQLEVNPLKLAYREWQDMIDAMMRGEQVEMKLETDIMEALPLEPYDPAVRLRRTFSCREKIKKARLYVTAHGIYDVKINGQDVTESVLKPGFTTYDKRILYQVYEIEDLLESENAISVTVADGWYKGKIAIGRGCEYGEVPGLLMQMSIWYENGETEIIASDQSWSYSYDGPVRSADLYLGEVYDAEMEDGDPSLISYEEKGWNPVFVKDAPDDTLEAQEYPQAKIIKEIPAQKVWTTPKGETVVDFGQNLAGVTRVAIRGNAGERISFEHGECLDKDGNFFYIFADSYRGQKDTYICKGDGVEIYQPKFTYHGFRYVRVTGGADWTKEQFTMLAISSDNRVTGAFHCSDEKINQLQSNIYWSQRSNNITIPTDCPTREKAGWTGDVVVYGATALFNQEMTAFYKSWLSSIRAEQLENGQVQNTVPLIKSYVSQAGAGSLGWGDVILTLPWQLYQLYGDKSVLADNYEAMGKWLGAMEQAAYDLPNPYTTMGFEPSKYENLEGRHLDNQHYLINSGFHFGDWIIPSVVNEQGFTDGPMSAFLTMNYADTALLAHIADLYAEISEVLGYPENAGKYQAYAKRVREAFEEEYVTPDLKLGQEMQGNYILALKYHMVSEETAKAFAARLNELIVNNGCCLDTGFMSTPHLMDVLCDYGYQDTAWKVLFQTKCPSWLYEVEKGATTIWENWDAIRTDGELNNCSFNHYAFGCIGDFMYRRILGIQNVGIAYDHILLAPEYDVPLTYAEGSYDSVRGRIEMRWEKKDGVIHISGSVPANTDALLRLPNGEEKALGSGKFDLSA
ncbi:MAG: glycoside hydrolase family 78 protein [Lachnospiraceae bacterium]|nr:glycoside hydrolase family 78 protein [Lachnospiraceae bacterium]